MSTQWTERTLTSYEFGTGRILWVRFRGFEANLHGEGFSSGQAMILRGPWSLIRGECVPGAVFLRIWREKEHSLHRRISAGTYDGVAAASATEVFLNQAVIMSKIGVPNVKAGSLWEQRSEPKIWKTRNYLMGAGVSSSRKIALAYNLRIIHQIIFRIIKGLINATGTELELIAIRMTSLRNRWTKKRTNIGFIIIFDRNACYSIIPKYFFLQKGIA